MATTGRDSWGWRMAIFTRSHLREAPEVEVEEKSLHEVVGAVVVTVAVNQAGGRATDEEEVG